MLIREVSGQNVDTARLTALAQFLIDRAQDTSANKTFDLSAFLSLAANMGISMTGQQLKDMSLIPPLSNLIDDIELDEINPEDGTIYFKGAGAAEPAQMSVDQARKTVDSMAKRASKKKGL